MITGKPKEKSLQTQLITIIMLVALPLSLLLLFHNLYSLNAFNRRIADSNQRMVDLHIANISRELEAVDETLSSLIAGNSDFLLLSGGAPPLQAHLSSLALYNQLKTVMPAYSSVDAFFVYSIPSSTERDLFSDGYTYEEKNAVRAFLQDCAAHDRITYNMQWKYAQVDEGHYLFRFFGGRGTYVAAMVPLSNLVGGADLGMDGQVITTFTTRDNLPLTQQELIAQNDISLEGDYSSYFFSGSPRYMVIGRDIEATDCRLVILVGAAGYLRSLNTVQIVLLLLSLFAIVLVPLTLSWLHRSVLRPLRSIMDVMDRVQGGDWEAQASTQGQVLEFRQMTQTFNTMMTQIKSLKIEAYEKELDAQRAELRYLQLQIRPHFFLNCLKSVYAFAQQKQLEKLQQMILAFSRHIRYIFQDNMDFVPLEKELDHIRNYIEIQGISAVNPPVCVIETAPELLNFPIPPLSIQTFVENSVKHETTPGKQLIIEIRAHLLESEGETYVDITVGDNGSGFPEELLPELNCLDGNVYSQHHIGINNVKKRIKMVYGSDVMFAFFNSGGGSVSEIFIPVDPAQLEKQEP